MDVLITAGLFVLGLVFLIVGADILVRGASALAVTIGISPLVVGLTVVAFGTSAPELAVGVRAGLFGQAGETDIALGNVVGSNIANILLILGLGAIFGPLIVQKQLLRFDLPIMIGASLLLLPMSYNGHIGHVDGLVLLAGILLYTGWSIYKSRQDEKKVSVTPDTLPLRESVEDKADEEATSNWPLNIAFIIGGLCMLVFGSDWLVNGASQFALALGVSELIIGLTIVAVGTSLPEVATTVAATLKGERDLAVGNAVGSNIFNLLLILGATSVVSAAGITVSDQALFFDFPVMIGVALICVPVFYTGWVITRLEGIIFLGYYVAYLLYLVLASTQSALLPVMQVLLLVLIPVTFGVFIVRSVRFWRSEAQQDAVS
jgi:cation:H+ antiporter